jgi:hypothetical protein
MERLQWLLEAGEGRTKVSLAAGRMGKGILVLLDNEASHIGAVAVSEFDHKENRASISVMTLLGHKDDTVAYQAAHEICRKLRVPVCVVAGIHLDNISAEEIQGIIENAREAVRKLLKFLEEVEKPV